MSRAVARDIAEIRSRWLSKPAAFTSTSDWICLLSNLQRSVRSNNNRMLFRGEDPKYLRSGLLRIAAAAVCAIECLDRVTASKRPS